MKNKTTERLMPRSLRNSSLAVLPAAKVEKDAFRALISEWLASKTAQDVSPRTTADYREKIFKFWWWWTDGTHYSEKLGEHPRHVTIREMREFAVYLRTPMAFRWGEPVVRNKLTLSPASVAAYGRSVKVFFNWLASEGYIEKAPFDKTVSFTVKVKDQKPVETVPEDEMAAVFAYLSSPERMAFFDGVRDLAIISFLYDTGVRKGELLQMHVDDLDLPHDRCKVTGKTGTRIVHFSPQCRQALNRYKELRGEFEIDTGLFWVTVELNPLTYYGLSSIVARIRKKTGVDFHAHMLRHTYATTLTNLGVGIADLARLMGHRKIETTMRYIHQSTERLGEVYRPISPLKNLKTKKPTREK